MAINFVNNNQFDIYMNYGTSINNEYLNDFYLPIIGKNALNLYNLLVNQYKSKIYSSIFINNYQRLLKKLEIEKDELFSCFNLLESVSLITTYQDNSDLVNIKKIYFINEPLNFYNFIQNENFNKILKLKITDEEYTELKYKYNNHIVKSSFVNISKDISYLINKIDHKEYELDFDTVYTLLSKKINNHFIIDEICMDKIKYFYKKHNLTIIQIVDCLYNSLSIEANNYVIVYDSLLMNLENILKNECTIYTIAKINRKFDFFLRNTDDEFYKSIYNDYNTFNSENYILSITKNELGPDLIHLLSNLRKKYNLHDSIINCIVDYSLFHNGGNLVPKYIEKVANSINNLSINSLVNVVKYLRDVNANVKPINSLTANSEYLNSINKTPVNDDNISLIWKEIE